MSARPQPGESEPMMLSGIEAAVEKARPLEPLAGRQGIGASATIGPRGELLLALTTVHADGTMLSAMLDSAAVEQLRGMLADFDAALVTLALPTLPPRPH